ncbi:hypothetical protein BDZ97DRAFT_1853230, partial [Flammula alnicola]
MPEQADNAVNGRLSCSGLIIGGVSLINQGTNLIRLSWSETRGLISGLSNSHRQRLSGATN